MAFSVLGLGSAEGRWGPLPHSSSELLSIGDKHCLLIPSLHPKNNPHHILPLPICVPGSHKNLMRQAANRLLIWHFKTSHQYFSDISDGNELSLWKFVYFLEVKWKFGFLFKARNQSEAFIFRPSNLFPLETILKNGFMKNMLDFILHNAIIKKKKIQKLVPNSSRS